MLFGDSSEKHGKRNDSGRSPGKQGADVVGIDETWWRMVDKKPNKRWWVWSMTVSRGSSLRGKSLGPNSFEFVEPSMRSTVTGRMRCWPFLFTLVILTACYSGPSAGGSKKRSVSSVPSHGRDASPGKSAVLSRKELELQQRKRSIDRRNELQRWKAVGHNLWQSKDGDLAFRTMAAVGEAGPSVYVYLTEIEDKQLKDVIDRASFRHIRGDFYRDDHHVFHHFQMAHGGRLDLKDNVDPETFHALNGCYFRDKGAIYTDRGSKVDDADLDSFRTTEQAGCFAKDMNGYFFWDSRITLSDLDEAGKEAIEHLGPVEKPSPPARSGTGRDGRDGVTF